jgi:pantothenate kinase
MRFYKSNSNDIPIIKTIIAEEASIIKIIVLKYFIIKFPKPVIGGTKAQSN